MGQPQQLGALSLTPRKEYVKPRVRDDKPAYIVAGRGFYDQYCTFWNPGQMLYFEGEPNLDLIPLNKLAFDKLSEFIDKLDALGERKAKKEGKAYTPMARMEWTEEGAVEDLPQPTQVMGARIEGHNDAIR